MVGGMKPTRQTDPVTRSLETGEGSFVDALVMLAESVGEPQPVPGDLPPRRREAELAKRLRAALRQGGTIRRAA
jgi:hypothetical protein